MVGRWRPGGTPAFGCAAVVCALLLLAGCGRPTAGDGTASTGTPTRSGTGTPVVGASPATPATRAALLNVDNASGTPRPWSASPVLAPALAMTPTPRVCPTLEPRSATAAVAAGGTCQQVALYTAGSPSVVVAVAVDGVIEVQWRTSGGIATHYEVYRQVVPRGAWVLLVSVATVGTREAPGSPDRATPYAWRDTTAVSGTTYRYAIDQVSPYGFASSPAQASLPIIAP